jgi:hypothetical protein
LRYGQAQPKADGGEELLMLQHYRLRLARSSGRMRQEHGIFVRVFERVMGR